MTLTEPEMCQVRGAEIALIFQEPMTALNPVFTIGDQIAETLVVHGRANRREAIGKAAELLDAVRIPDARSRVNDYPHQLSGGMRQRVLIAMALACRPSLVIADEPTTALDVTIQAQILDLLREMKAAFNLSLLLITHDLGVIAGTADRVAVMYAGRHRRGRTRAHDLSRAGASVHARAAGLDAGRRPGPAAARHRRQRADHGRAAARLRVQSALPRSFRAVHRRAAAGLSGRRRPSSEVLPARSRRQSAVGSRQSAVASQQPAVGSPKSAPDRGARP